MTGTEAIKTPHPTDPASPGPEQPLTLRLVWPQWHGASVAAVRQLLAEVPLADSGRAYTVGAAVLQAVLPPHPGPAAVVPVVLGE